MQDALLALLDREPAHGYELRTRLAAALGPLGRDVSSGQVYVTLGRLEKAGLVRVRAAEDAEGTDRAERKVYEVTATGRERIGAWLTETTWPRSAPTEFHLKLVAVAASGLAEPVALIEAQRRELIRQLREVQQAEMAEPDGSSAGMLLAGAVLRLLADLEWLEACTMRWGS